MCFVLFPLKNLCTLVVLVEFSGFYIVSLTLDEVQCPQHLRQIYVCSHKISLSGGLIICVQLLWIAAHCPLSCGKHCTSAALSPSVNLETARQERILLLAGGKRLLREGNDVALLSNQKGNYESLKLILIRLECMCILPEPPKRCTWILTCSVCPVPNTYVGMQSCIWVMMWWWCGGPATSYPNEVLGSTPQTWLNGLALLYV